MGKWHKIKEWFKSRRIKSRSRHIDVTCGNCQTLFSGHYCPECGQAVNDYDKPFSFIFYNFVGDFFAFDTRFYKTFLALLIRPGFLSKEYFEGRRARYAPPFRVFIFMSFILFLLLQIYTNRGLNTVLDSSFKENAFIVGDSSVLVTTDSIMSDLAKELEVDPDSDINYQINLESFRDTRELRGFLEKLAVGMEKDLQSETNPERKRKLTEYIRLCRSPEQAVARILEYMSWAFFLLLPVFALILKLFYIRRNQNFMRHLIFSIHTHSFIFLIFTIIVSLYLIFKGNLETISTILVFSIPVYLLIAMKKFYGQKSGVVLLKFIGVSFVYNIIFWIILLFVFLNALSII